ncbi:hypothetical protein [Methylobrevis albus]|uniref:OmpA-like domain-containing protein n=1 Tax=Methylobrevis albus TaxID=2793297 RepID=A0A931HYE0_9HYPH|nr:hypothetical protein [Methylobrevis albus]MBH0236852.1 hypothetical protein [Methylobrevis albus]
MRFLTKAIATAAVLVGLAAAAAAATDRTAPVSLAFSTRTMTAHVDGAAIHRFDMAFPNGATDVSGRAASDLRRQFPAITALLARKEQMIVAVTYPRGDVAARDLAYARAQAIRVRLLAEWSQLRAHRFVVAALAEDPAARQAGGVLVAPVVVDARPGEDADRNARAVALDSAFVGPVVAEIELPAAEPVLVAASEAAPVAVPAPRPVADVQVLAEAPVPAAAGPVHAAGPEPVSAAEPAVAAVLPPLPMPRPAVAVAAAPAARIAEVLHVPVPAVRVAGAPRVILAAPATRPAQQVADARPAARTAAAASRPPIVTPKPAAAPRPAAALTTVAAALPAQTCPRPAVIIDDFYPGGPIVPCPADVQAF